MTTKFPDPKVGEMVALHIQHNEVTKCAITRVLATQIEVDGRKFLRRTGFSVGRLRYIEPWTLEVEARIEERRLEAMRKDRQTLVMGALVDALNDLKWKDREERRLTLEQCEAVERLTAEVKMRVGLIIWEHAVHQEREVADLKERRAASDPFNDALTLLEGASAYAGFVLAVQTQAGSTAIATRNTTTTLRARVDEQMTGASTVESWPT